MTGEVEWIVACRVDDIPRDEGVRVEATPPVAVFRLGDDVFAIDDTCTHGDFSLAEGLLTDDGYVQCIGHMAQFCVRTGRAVTLPATIDVQRYETRVVDDMVHLRIGRALP
jgi:3-phenylpropionate/trans-cinnamate dioxygenase ferredoxin component